MAHENDWVSIKESSPIPSTKRYLKLEIAARLDFTAGTFYPTCVRDPGLLFDYFDAQYQYRVLDIECRPKVTQRLKIFKYIVKLNNTFLSDLSTKIEPAASWTDGGHIASFTPSDIHDSLYTESSENTYNEYPTYNATYSDYNVQLGFVIRGYAAPTENGSTIATIQIIFVAEENETAEYNALLNAYPDNVSPWYPLVDSVPFRQNFPDILETVDPFDKWLIDDDIPYRVLYPVIRESINPYNTWVIDDDIPYRINYPEMHESINPDNNWVIDDDIPYRLDYQPLIESINPGDVWLIDDDIPYRFEYPEMKKSVGSPTSWLQTNGYEPYRPWPNHKTIFQTVEPVEVPSVDWSKGMQQTFEYYTVDPNTWYDVLCLTNIISCSLTHDSSSEMRGHASITTSEPLDENYIRIYMRVRQNGINQRFCLGTYLFIVSSDSFNGKRHSYTYTGYTPLIELKEKLAPLGYNVIGITGEKPELLPPRTAPTVTDEISRVIGQYSRLKLENNVLIERPLLNNFVSGTSDTWLAVVNNLLTASTLQQYELSVDNWGAVRIKEAITVYNEKHVYEYDDGNSSILLPTLDLTDDMTDIPNVVEVIYTGNGNKDIGYVRKVVKNEDTRSIVSIPSRGREIWRRFVISNIAMPLGEVTRDAIEDQVEGQAKRLLEAASTIRKTIQYSHGFNGVEVGDTVLFNYERAGFTGIKAKVVSQTINCKPGCQVDETAVYTKRLWNRN